jgi:type II secretory pathway pseudopilin PulG
MRREAGFTYLGLIVTVAIIGLVGAATLKVDALLRRAAAEEELLETGAAFSAALRSYADATPRGQPRLPPPSLQDLLKDPRYPGVRRHLRKIFVDPMTGKAAWGIVYANNPGGASGLGSGFGSGFGSGNGNGSGVLAVYSLSQAKPLKVAHFDARFQNLDNKDHISDWKFAASGQTVQVGAPAQAGPGQGPQAPGTAAPGQPAQSLFGPPAGQGGVLPAQAGQGAPANAPSLFRSAPTPSAPAPAVETPPGEAAAAQDEQDSQDPPEPPAAENGNR